MILVFFVVPSSKNKQKKKKNDNATLYIHLVLSQSWQTLDDKKKFLLPRGVRARNKISRNDTAMSPADRFTVESSSSLADDYNIVRQLVQNNAERALTAVVSRERERESFALPKPFSLNEIHERSKVARPSLATDSTRLTPRITFAARSRLSALSTSWRSGRLSSSRRRKGRPTVSKNY